MELLKMIKNRHKLGFLALIVAISVSLISSSALARDPEATTGLRDVPKDVVVYIQLGKLDAKGLQAFASTSKANAQLVSSYLEMLKVNKQPLPKIGFTFSCPSVEEIKAKTEINPQLSRIGPIEWLVHSLLGDGVLDGNLEYALINADEKKANILCGYSILKKQQPIYLFHLSRTIDGISFDPANCHEKDPALKDSIDRKFGPATWMLASMTFTSKEGKIPLKAGTVFYCPYR
jgi:hypothetical protein